MFDGKKLYSGFNTYEKYTVDKKMLDKYCFNLDAEIKQQTNERNSGRSR